MRKIDPNTNRPITVRETVRALRALIVLDETIDHDTGERLWALIGHDMTTDRAFVVEASDDRISMLEEVLAARIQIGCRALGLDEQEADTRACAFVEARARGHRPRWESYVTATPW